MEYHGYGVNFSRLKVSEHKFVMWLKKTHQGYGCKFEARLHEYNNDFDKTISQFNTLVKGSQNGLISLIIFICEKVDNIRFDYVMSDEGDEYLLLCKRSPWEYNDCERNLTRELLKNYFLKHLSEFTNVEPQDIDDMVVYIE